MTGLLTLAFQIFSAFVLVYFLTFAAVNIFLIIRGGLRLYVDTRHSEHADLLRAGTSPATPGVSMVVPAYNEQAGIVESVRSLLDIDYPRRELIVVNDGSTDSTFACIAEAFDLVEVPIEGTPPIPCSDITAMYISRSNAGLVVLDKVNGGRSDALNAGIGVARMELLFITDADGVIENSALLHAVQPFIDDPDHVIAAGGQVRIANGSRFSAGRLERARVSASPVAAIQTLEYVRGFLGSRTGWADMGGLTICSGAFGVFRRVAVVAVGGLDRGSLGEDFELTLHLLEAYAHEGVRVAQASDAACWTEAPASLRDLRTQRRRWHVGLLETLWRYRGMLLRRRHGAVGLFALPYLWAFEVAGPVIETLGYVAICGGWALGLVDAAYALTLFVVAVLLGVMLSISNVLLEEIAYGRYPRMRDAALLMLYAVLENLGYRQLTSWWRMRTTIELLCGRRPGWGSITRVGVGGSGTEGETPTVERQDAA